MITPWLSLGGILLGFWLIASPFDAGYNHLICGSLLILLGIGGQLLKSVWFSWGFALVGFWLGLAPLLFWEPLPQAYLNDTVVGVLSIALFLKMPSFPNQVPDSGPGIPPGWTYNPSSWPQRLPIAFLAFTGWMISRYLASYQLGYIEGVWEPFFESTSLPYKNETLDVITSQLSKSFPISDAGLGAFAYSLEMLSAFKGGPRRWRTEPWMVLLFGLLAIPLSLTSVFLIIMQPLFVGAWCTLCLFTAFCMLLLVALSLDEVAATFQYLRKKDKPFWKKMFEGGECRDAKDDTRTPKLTASYKSIFRAAFWGVSFPWNLSLSVVVGACLMALPWELNVVGELAAIDHTLGAFTIVVAMISFAEIARRIRFINVAFSVLILVGSLYYGHFFVHLAPAVLVGMLAFREGPLKEVKR